VTVSFLAAESAQAQDQAIERCAESDVRASEATQAPHSAVEGSPALVDGSVGYAVLVAIRTGFRVDGFEDFFSVVD
jgi:hypothetical protein